MTKPGKTNWQDPGTSEVRSTHISGLMEAVGKIEDVLDMQLEAETDVELTEVYISSDDRYRIYQAPEGKRNWASSPAPIIKKNGTPISTGFTIDYGGGAVIFNPSLSGSDTVTADFSRVKAIANMLVNVKSFGAKGDGVTDDATAIQNAINDAIANNKILYIPTGTYLLNGPRQQAYRPPSTIATDTILVINSNLTIIGDGYNSVLKVADNYTDGGDYRIFASDSIVVNNVEIAHIRIDGNGSNNLVIDSGDNIRRAYMINLLQGDNIYIHDCWFENCPGRNVIALGNNTEDEYDFTNVRIINNHFKDVGGAIIGNENQNDHSSIYLQGDHCLVHGNIFSNTVQPNPFGTPAKTIVALEIHGKNTIVSENQVNNYTGGGNAVAQIHDSINNQWINNQFTGMTSNILTLWTAGGYDNKRLVIRGNIFEIDNTTYDGGTAIFQNKSATITTKELENIVIEDNVIYATNYSQLAKTFHGIQLCAVNVGSIHRNKFRNTQGSGIAFEEPLTNTLSIKNIDIESNQFIDCGIHSSATRLWAIWINNTQDTREIANIRIRNNKISRTLQPAGVTPWGIRGIRVTGAGRINNVIAENNEFENIANYFHRYDFAGLTNAVGVTVVPKAIPNPKDADPTWGIWQNSTYLVEYVIHSNPVADGYIGKIPVTSGGAVSETWSSSTAYNVGQWIKTSANKVLRCVKAGTSDPSDEPSPTTTGIVVADGTVEWVYESATLAVFKTFGAIST